MAAQEPWRYCILPGNESCLMKEALDRRSCWMPADIDLDSDVTAVTKPVMPSNSNGARSRPSYSLWYGGNGQKFSWEQHKDLLQQGSSSSSSAFIVNRLPGNRQISTKSRLAQNLQQLQRAAGGPFPWVPPTLLLPGGLPQGHVSYQSLLQLCEQGSDRGNPSRSSEGGAVGSKGLAVQQQHQLKQGVGSKPGGKMQFLSSSSSSSSSSTKGTSKASKEGAAAAASGTTTGTRHQRYSDDTQAEQMDTVGPKPISCSTSTNSTCTQEAADQQQQGRLLILKPTCANRGRGIRLCEGPQQGAEWLSQQAAGSSWIVQLYVPDPLLLPGNRKFDIRCYVLVTPDSKVYLHREAYARTCCSSYTPGDTSDLSGHLTNDAVQKLQGSYHTFEDHSKLSLQQLQEVLGDQLDVAGGLWPQIRAAVRTLFTGVLPQLNPSGLAHCYELFGLDFLVDCQGQAYLLEVNSSPALFRAGAYLADLLPRVVEEVVQKAVDPWLPPAANTTPPTAAAGDVAAAAPSSLQQLNGFELMVDGSRRGFHRSSSSSSSSSSCSSRTAGSSRKQLYQQQQQQLRRTLVGTRRTSSSTSSGGGFGSTSSPCSTTRSIAAKPSGGAIGKDTGSTLGLQSRRSTNGGCVGGERQLPPVPEAARRRTFAV